MKIYRKLACTLAVGTIMATSFSNVSASEYRTSQMSKVMQEQKGFNQVLLDSTSGSISTDKDTTPPRIGDIKFQKIDNKYCLVVHVEDTQSDIESVIIDDHSAYRRYGSSRSGDYYIETIKENPHTIRVCDVKGNSRTYTNEYVNISDTKKPTVELSQTYKNNNCYLVIEAEDNTAIASVTVDGSSISFDSNGGKETYKVTKSKTYTVTVRDIAGNTTTEKYDIDINNSKPSLTLDKVYKNGKWYLTIKAYPSGNARISKVTVNNSKISFSSSGGTTEYEVTGSGNYNVVVKDSYDQETSQSISVDTNQNGTSYNPSLSLSQSNVGGVMCIQIKSQPSGLINNNKITSVTVNGQAISFPQNGGSIDYTVFNSGSYTVVVKDQNGNQATQTINVTVPTASTIPTVPTVPSVPSSGSIGTGSSKVVFTLNKKSWIRNGVTQSMEAAPIARNGRIYIPIRYVAYALNISSGNVMWDKTSKTAIIKDGSSVVKVPLGSKIMDVNGVSQTMEAAAISYNQRIYIPISQVTKAFPGVSCSWDNATKQATIGR